ncbi:MAG: DUF4388 domain-containing protein [Cyanobacteria bacterium P01_D01_bin.105]
MNIQGLTSEFSLPELLKFLQESQQTGRLSLTPTALDSEKRVDSENRVEETSYLFWFSKGNLIAVSNRVDGLGLSHMLQSRSLIQHIALPQLLRQCPPKAALGIFLRDRDLLTNKQLKSLFASQVLKQIYTLLKVSDSKFTFQESGPLPYLEMTGVSIRATDVTLSSLRILKDWGVLTDKLPCLESGLKPTDVELSSYRLQTKEKEVLRLAEKGLSLIEISKVLKLPALDVQRMGFCLSFVGLVKEVPLVRISKPTVPQKRKRSWLGAAFFKRLFGYLKRTPAKAPHTGPIATNAPVADSMAINRTPVSNQGITHSQGTIDSQKTINTDKTARNSAVQRIKTVISKDRSERLPSEKLPERRSNGSSAHTPTTHGDRKALRASKVTQ